MDDFRNMPWNQSLSLQDLIEKGEKQPNLSIGILVSIVVIVFTVVFKLIFGGKKQVSIEVELLSTYLAFCFLS